MSKISAKNCVILVNGYVLSADMTQYEAFMGVNPVDVTGFTEPQNFTPGQTVGKLSLSALWNNAAGRANAALKAPTYNKIVTLIPEGYTLGAPTLSMPYMQENFNPSGTPSDAIRAGTINFSNYGNSAGLEIGWALAHGTITDTTTGTPVLDPTNGAVTAACAGVLHVWGAAATDTYVVKIQHCATVGGVYADLITFTINGSALGSERVAVASGTINKYRRVLATRTGSAGDNFSFSVHFWHG